MWAYTQEEEEFYTKGASALSNNSKQKETKMNFEFNTMIEEYRKNARLALSFVTHKDLKHVLEKAIDVQVDFSKLTYDAAKDGFKNFVPAGK
jgi:hypothetical protein